MRTTLILLVALALPALAADPKAKAPATPPAKAAAPEAKGPKRVELQVTADGFQPSSIPLKKGEPVKLVVTRVSDETCATDLLIEGTKNKVALPMNKAVEVDYTPTTSGKIKFGCAMGMMVSGVLLVE
jgi:plastocyanin domain-containing protein